jgi:hypothetical protein
MATLTSTVGGDWLRCAMTISLDKGFHKDLAFSRSKLISEMRVVRFSMLRTA